MKYSMRALAVALASVGTAVLANPAAGHAVTRQHARDYEHAYHAVAHKFGRRAPGRNIVRWGLPRRRATDARIVQSTAVLERMLAPPPPPPPPAPVAQAVAAPSAAPVASASSSGSSGSLPSCTWVPESGGNWSAVNSSSGAGGRYQIMPSTWQAYGGSGSPASASPGEQTAIAQKIYNDVGGSAWTNC